MGSAAENNVLERTSEVKDAAEGVEAAQKKLEFEQEQQKQQQQSHAQLLTEKVEFEDVYKEAWQAVKAGTIPGKDWRARNKTIDMIMRTLKKAGIVQSLASALPVALKLKPADRGPFAEKTIEFGEEFFTNHITEQTESSANIETKVAEQGQAVAAAQAASVATGETHVEKLEELRAANDLSKAARQEHDEAVAMADATVAKLEKFAIALEKERQNLVCMQELAANFGALKERKTVTVVETPTGEVEKIVNTLGEVSVHEEAATEVPVS